MKYVKTFENFSTDMDKEQVMPSDTVQSHDIDSPEVKDALANVAQEYGADVDLVLKTAEDLADEPVKHNEEEEPFPTMAEWGGIALGGLALAAGVFGIYNWEENKKLKAYVQYKAEEEVKAAVKADPRLIDKGYEALVKATFDRMMADKEFVAKVKQGNMNVPGTPRYRGFSPTAGQL